MVAGQHDVFRISDMDGNLQGLKMYLCAKLGCSAPDCGQIERDLVYYNKMFITHKWCFQLPAPAWPLRL